jgi:hypothetical protein
MKHRLRPRAAGLHFFQPRRVAWGLRLVGERVPGLSKRAPGSAHQAARPGEDSDGCLISNRRPASIGRPRVRGGSISGGRAATQPPPTDL